MAEETPRAADLPDGSVVADGWNAYIKNQELSQWRGTNGCCYGDRQMDKVLAEGATVQRVGTGE